MTRRAARRPVECPRTGLALTLPPPTPLSPPTEGVKAEAAFAKDKTLPDPNSTTNPEFKIVLSIIKDTLQKVGAGGPRVD